MEASFIDQKISLSIAKALLKVVDEKVGHMQICNVEFIHTCPILPLRIAVLPHEVPAHKKLL